MTVRCFLNGNFRTMNPAQPRARAVVTRGDRIIFVGAEEDALRVAGPGAARVDLQGRLVLPGGILPTNAPIPVEESDLDAESDAEELDEVDETGDEVTE